MMQHVDSAFPGHRSAGQPAGVLREILERPESVLEIGEKDYEIAGRKIVAQHHARAEPQHDRAYDRYQEIERAAQTARQSARLDRFVQALRIVVRKASREGFFE